MEIFDNYYRPDVPSQRYRLLAVTLPIYLLSGLPWLPPAVKWLAQLSPVRKLAQVADSGLRLAGATGFHLGPGYVVRAVLVVLTALWLLSNLSLQIKVLRGFAPGSRMLRLSQKLLAVDILLLLALFWAWPSAR